MEELNVILQAIANYGFPIVMCLILIKYMNNTNNKHQKEIKEITNALNGNTLVLQKLCDKLDAERENV